jgi:hypothetical protein
MVSIKFKQPISRVSISGFQSKDTKPIIEGNISDRAFIENKNAALLDNVSRVSRVNVSGFQSEDAKNEKNASTPASISDRARIENRNATSLDSDSKTSIRKRELTKRKREENVRKFEKEEKELANDEAREDVGDDATPETAEEAIGNLAELLSLVEESSSDTISIPEPLISSPRTATAPGSDLLSQSVTISRSEQELEAVLPSIISVSNFDLIATGASAYEAAYHALVRKRILARSRGFLQERLPEPLPNTPELVGKLLGVDPDMSTFRSDLADYLSVFGSYTL